MTMSADSTVTDEVPTLELPRSALGGAFAEMGKNTAELDYNALAIEEGGELTQFFQECVPGDEEIARLHRDFHSALASTGRDIEVPLERFAQTLRARCFVVAQRDEVTALKVAVRVRDGRVFVDVESR